jgi:DNA polymerase
VLRRASTLRSVAAEVKSCQLCPLAKERTSAVPGEGPYDARIVLIGEAPGKEEDLSGRPFVGRAGRLLNSVLESVGIPREHVFITNIVKCRPPKNRQPTKRERDTCTEAYLQRQIDVIRPRLVVLLGRTAAQALLGADSLKSVRGRLVRRGRVEYLCTYHPAAVLRNPRRRGTFSKDLQELRTSL